MTKNSTTSTLIPTATFNKLEASKKKIFSSNLKKCQILPRTEAEKKERENLNDIS